MVRRVCYKEHSCKPIPLEGRPDRVSVCLPLRRPARRGSPSLRRRPCGGPTRRTPPLLSTGCRGEQERMRKPSQTKCLLITYMRSRDKVSDDGHFGAIVARLVKHAILQHHKYIRILFESKVKVPIVALGLQGRAVEPLGSLLPVLL